MSDPEKIPMNPIGQDRPQSPYTAAEMEKTQNMDESPGKLFGRSRRAAASSQVQLSTKDKLLLALLIVVLMGVAIAAGVWLFKDQVGL